MLRVRQEAGDRCPLVASGSLIKVFSFQFRQVSGQVAGGFWQTDLSSCYPHRHTVTVAPTRQKHFKVPVKMKYVFVNF